MNRQLTQPQVKANTVILALKNLGYNINSQDENTITFYYKKSLVTYYLNSDWVRGDAIKAGTGLRHLLEQVKFR